MKVDWKNQGKALAGLLVIIVGSLATATSVGNTNLGDLSARDWLIAGGAALGSAAGVAFLSNIPGTAGGITKAVWAAASAGIAPLILAMEPESAGGKIVTQSEWLGAFVVALVASGVVYQKTEATKPG